MDVASGVVAFVGFAGQLLQGVSYIYDFLSDVHDAPEEIQQLCIRLRLIRGILQSMVVHSQAICASTAMASNIQEAMELVHQQVEKLSSLVKEHTPTGIGRRAVLWSSLNVAFRRKKFARYITNLDYARDLLQMAQMSIDRYSWFSLRCERREVRVRGVKP